MHLPQHMHPACIPQHMHPIPFRQEKKSKKNRKLARAMCSDAADAEVDDDDGEDDCFGGHAVCAVMRNGWTARRDST